MTDHADEELVRTLATDVLAFAQLGGMPDTYWHTDTRIARACQVLGLTPDQARNHDFTAGSR